MEQVKVFFQELSSGSKHLDASSDELNKNVNEWLLEQGEKIELISRQTCVSGNIFCLSLFFKPKK